MSKNEIKLLLWKNMKQIYKLAQNGTIFATNINWFSTFFTVKIKRKWVIPLSLKITRLLKCVATLSCHSCVLKKSTKTRRFAFKDKAFFLKHFAHLHIFFLPVPDEMLLEILFVKNFVTKRVRLAAYDERNSTLNVWYTECFIKGPLFVFFIIHSNDDQFKQNVYQL